MLSHSLNDRACEHECNPRIIGKHAQGQITQNKSEPHCCYWQFDVMFGNTNMIVWTKLKLLCKAGWGRKTIQHFDRQKNTTTTFINIYLYIFIDISYYYCLYQRLCRRLCTRLSDLLKPCVVLDVPLYYCAWACYLRVCVCLCVRVCACVQWSSASTVCLPPPLINSDA